MAGNKIAQSFGWKFLERIGAQGTSFLLTIILARLLLPDDYGLVALLTVFISLATTFVQCGFNTALIQKPVATSIDYCAGAFCSLMIALFLYGLFFIGAPGIAAVYNRVELVAMTRVLAVVLFPGAFNSIQIAKLARELRFKAIFFSGMGATILSALIGILFAWQGVGAWALVYQQVSYQVFSCIFTAFCTRWTWTWNGWQASAREMLPFGSKVLANNLLVSLFLNLRTLLIGHFYGPEDLGFFNRGKQFPQAIMESINGTMQTVFLPVYARAQDDREELLALARRSIQLSCFIIFPMLFGMISLATPLIRWMLTDKWVPCVPYLQIFALTYLFLPIQTATAQAMRAVGNSKTPLMIETARKILEIIMLVISIFYGVKAIAWTSVISGILGIFIGFKPNFKVLGYQIKDQITDILGPIFYSLVMATVVQFTIRSISGNLFQIFAGIAVGVVSYVGISFFARAKALGYLLEYLKKRNNH